MTLEIKRLHATAPYSLGGVQKITDKTEYGDGRFAITIFDRRIFVTSCFDELYGKGLDVENWHLNGELEPFDNFYDAALDEMEGMQND